VRTLDNSPCAFVQDGILAIQRIRDAIVEIPCEMVRGGIYGSLDASCELGT
jgi:hypothetical protein